MRPLRPELLDILRTGFDPMRWPGVLADPGGEAVLRRFEAAMAALGGRHVDVLDRWAHDKDLPPGTVRSALWAIGLAAQTGSSVVGLDYPYIVLETATGTRWLLVALPFEVPVDPFGDAEAVSSLVEALSAALDSCRYALHLRKPLPDQFDALLVAHAAGLWLRAIRRGEWSGRQAVYDDGPVSLAIELLDDGAPRTRCQFVVPPLRSAERLASIDTAFMDALSGRASVDADAGVVAVACADPAWSLPREAVTQYLLGTPEWIVASGPSASQYTATFSSRSVCMFSDSLCRDLAAIWLVDQDGADPLAAAARAWVNPWCPREVGGLPGARLAPVGPVDGDTATLTWTGDAPARWRAA